MFKFDLKPKYLLAIMSTLLTIMLALIVGKMFGYGTGYEYIDEDSTTPADSANVDRNNDEDKNLDSVMKEVDDIMASYKDDDEEEKKEKEKGEKEFNIKEENFTCGGDKKTNKEEVVAYDRGTLFSPI